MGKVQKKLATVFRLFKQTIEENEEFKKEIYNEETGMIFNSKIMFTTEEDENETISMIFDNGNVEVIEGKVENPSITLKYKKVKDLGKLPRSRPDEIVHLLLKNKIHAIGNFSHMTKFFFLLCYILLKHKEGYDQRQLERAKKEIISF